ncbi:hypothetical protein Tco_0547207, partial [Tanacetum coccineum]
ARMVSQKMKSSTKMKPVPEWLLKLLISKKPSSSKLVPNVVPLAVKTATSRQELELLFHHHIAMLRTDRAGFTP